MRFEIDFVAADKLRHIVKREDTMGSNYSGRFLQIFICLLLFGWCLNSLLQNLHNLLFVSRLCNVIWIANCFLSGKTSPHSLQLVSNPEGPCDLMCKSSAFFLNVSNLQIGHLRGFAVEGFAFWTAVETEGLTEVIVSWEAGTFTLADKLKSVLV